MNLFGEFSPLCPTPLRLAGRARPRGLYCKDDSRRTYMAKVTLFYGFTRPLAVCNAMQAEYYSSCSSVLLHSPPEMFGWGSCLFVSRVGSNFLCLTNRICIRKVPRVTNETWVHWNGLCSYWPRPRTPSTLPGCIKVLDLKFYSGFCYLKSSTPSSSILPIRSHLYD